MLCWCLEVEGHSTFSSCTAIVPMMKLTGCVSPGVQVRCAMTLAGWMRILHSLG